VRSIRTMTNSLIKAAGGAAWFAMGGSRAEGMRTDSVATLQHSDRRTTSACPWCHTAALNSVLNGAMDEKYFENRAPYLIAAEIFYRDNQIWMRKTCPEHGVIEDLVSSDAAFTSRMESLYYPQDPNREPPQGGRRKPSGLMLVVDLTNRCNMKCSPCFMDANHHSYVRESTLEDVRRILERAAASGTRRALDILFSGGEPTISPIFLDCVQLAKSLGFGRVHAATNGIRFAQESDFAKVAKEAGLHGVFLQFDGLSTHANRHRGVSNLVDVKLAALDRIHAAGLKTVLQVTVTNNLNNSEVGRIVEFAVSEIDRIQSVLFQPLVFTGRDELPSDEDRHRRRYTLAQLAHDLGAQSSFDWQPLRDWFPISASGAFGNLMDALDVEAEFQSPAHDLHATHGQFSFLLVDTETGRTTPLSAFFSIDRFLRDAATIAQQTHSPVKARVLLVASILRNFSLDRAPGGLTIGSLRQLFRQLAGRLKNAKAERATRSLSRWRFLAIHAVWFEDPFNVDFEAVCRSCAPVATEEGEFSFCAYNSMGWRQIVENKHRTADLSDWHRQNGRHAIYANGATVPLESLTTRGAQKLRGADSGQPSVRSGEGQP
jgi:uncharacterized radical SAM superfamily Fe-S cluster-containing enzyme